jgi:fic family protein
MEGSALSEDQTRRIFETNTIDSEVSLSVDDIIETINHFRAIDYCIDIADEPLTESNIKHLHYILKSRTKDETLSWFNVGEYKARPNIVGGMETSEPKDVATDMQHLLFSYTEKMHISFEDIVEFHFRFERIHPFQDGNGRVGRLIAFKECLKHKLVPFIIEDKKKSFYYRGLSEYLNEPGYLIDTCYDGQETMMKLLEYFKVELSPE